MANAALYLYDYHFLRILVYSMFLTILSLTAVYLVSSLA